MMFGLRAPAGPSPLARVRPALLFGVRTLRCAWTVLPPTARNRHMLSTVASRIAADDVGDPGTGFRVCVDGSRILCVSLQPYRGTYIPYETK